MSASSLEIARDIVQSMIAAKSYDPNPRVMAQAIVDMAKIIDTYYCED